MCIVAFAWQVIEDLPLCLISNRDEFYHRPASAIHAWQDSAIVAGQDLQSGGTWLGITATGRWAIITNFRDARDKTHYSTSRGHIIQQFLTSDLAPIRFAQQLEKTQCEYAGFNVFFGDKEQAVYMSNRGEAPQVLAKGVYVVSNGLMTEHWEKTKHLRKRFTQEFLPVLQLSKQTQIDALKNSKTAMPLTMVQATTALIEDEDLNLLVWDLLEDQRQVSPELLPNTGISAEMELLLSSTFIQSPVYGTRCSNFLKLTSNHWHWLEKTQHGTQQGQLVEQKLVLV